MTRRRRPSEEDKLRTWLVIDVREAVANLCDALRLIHAGRFGSAHLRLVVAERFVNMATRVDEYLKELSP